MGFGLVRNKREHTTKAVTGLPMEQLSGRIENRSFRRDRDRLLQGAVRFFTFSPVILQLRLMPRWVLWSLVSNGALAIAVGLLLLRGASPSTASPSTAKAENTTVATASAGAGSSSELGARHQLTYQQWVTLLAQEAKVAATQKPDQLNILAGDSISLWFPQALLPQQLNWLNQGISGETSAGLLRRLDLFDQTEPETIFVMVGINDLIKDVRDETLLANQQEIVQSLKEAHPEAQIVLQSILPHAGARATWEGRDRLQEISTSHIQELNEELEAIAEQEGVYYLDLYPLFADSQGNLRPELTSDGLHLSAQGYQVWSAALQVYTREVLEAQKRDEAAEE